MANSAGGMFPRAEWGLRLLSSSVEVMTCEFACRHLVLLAYKLPSKASINLETIQMKDMALALRISE